MTVLVLVQRISQLDDPPHFPNFGFNRKPGRARCGGAGSAQEQHTDPSLPQCRA
jgi:hypothetical protein